MTRRARPPHTARPQPGTAQPAAEKALFRILAKAHAELALRRLCPAGKPRGGKAGEGKPLRGWTADLQLVSAPAMRKLNAAYRKKDYATDVLSFPAPEPFRRQGHLGELVICLPLLKKQAKEQGHSSDTELEVLLAHGVLHLLGFDHEEGPKQAAAQAKWEAKLLGTLRNSGLIHRTRRSH